MSVQSANEKILALAVFELRVLLSSHINDGSSEQTPVSVAAHLAYALHNQALAVLRGETFDITDALESVRRVDAQFGEHFFERFANAAAQSQA
jgi:hypothetical protein